MQVKTAEISNMCDWVQSVLVLHRPFKRTVMGSNPVAPTNNINDLATPRGGFFMSQRRLQRQIEFFQIVTVRFFVQKNYDRPILCAKKTVTVRLLADAILLLVLFFGYIL